MSYIMVATTAAGAIAGGVKASSKRKHAEKLAKQRAMEIKMSPWTGREKFAEVPHVSMLGGITGGAASGLAMGQNISKLGGATKLGGQTWNPSQGAANKFGVDTGAVSGPLMADGSFISPQSVPKVAPPVAPTSIAAPVPVSPSGNGYFQAGMSHGGGGSQPGMSSANKIGQHYTEQFGRKPPMWNPLR